MCEYTYNFLRVLQIHHILQIFLSLISSCSLFFLPSLLPQWMPWAGSRAASGPGPPHGGLIGDHAPGGPCEGSRPRGWPGLSRAPARTPPISEEPLRGARGRGNRLLAVTDDAEGIVMGKDLTPLKGERGRLKSRRSGMVCSRGADAA